MWRSLSCLRQVRTILLYVCPHTTIHVPSYCYTCVLRLPYMCPHTTIYVPSYCYVCVLIRLYMCPHTKSQSVPWCLQQRASAARTIVTRTILTRTRGRSRLRRRGGGAQFTCFTRTKVQMLAQELQRQRPQTSRATPATKRTLLCVAY